MDFSDLENGFYAGKNPVTAWCDFFTDEFVFWELEEGDNVGSVPIEFHATILTNLRAIVKAKNCAKKKGADATCAPTIDSAEASTSGSRDS